MSMNRLHNSKNMHQGTHKKVLCVCSAGLLRSPTAALILAQEPYNFNTRAVGLETDFALVPIDDVLLEWADEVVCMTQEQGATLKKMGAKNLKILNVPDNFAYRDPELIELIKAAYKEL